MNDDVNVYRWSQEPGYGHYRYTRTPQACLPSYEVARDARTAQTQAKKAPAKEEQRTGLIVQFHLNLEFEYSGISARPTKAGPPSISKQKVLPRPVRPPPSPPMGPIVYPLSPAAPPVAASRLLSLDCVPRALGGSTVLRRWLGALVASAPIVDHEFQLVLRVCCRPHIPTQPFTAVPRSQAGVNVHRSDQLCTYLLSDATCWAHDSHD